MRSFGKIPPVTKKLYFFILLFGAILGIFVLLILVYLNSPPPQSDLQSKPAETTDVHVVDSVSGKVPPNGIPALPETFLNGNRYLVSMIKAVDIVLDDPNISLWVDANPGWRLADANSDSVDHSGLAVEWNVLLQSNRSILMATVVNGSVQRANAQDLSTSSIQGTDVNTLWDSTWIMYNTTTKSTLSKHYVDKSFPLDFSEDGHENLYHVTYNDLSDSRYSFDVQINASTGELISGEVWPYD